MNIASAKKVTVSGDCPICLEDMSKLTKVVITRCRHAFHEECMTRHFKTSEKAIRSCPYCRQIPIPMLRAQDKPNGQETNPFVECKMVSALRYGDLDYVKSAIIADPQLLDEMYESKVNNAKYPILTLAAAFGHQELVVFLLERTKKESIDRFNSNGLTALSAACRSGHTEIAKLLIIAGAEVNKTNHMGKNALWYAACAGNQETLKLLVESGSSVTNRSKENCTALLMAAQRGHLDAVDYLISVIPKTALKEHVNICSFSTASASALYMAAQEGYTAIVSSLIAAGADPNRAVSGAQIPLHIAAINGHLNVVRILVEKGTNVNRQDLNGITALLGAAAAGHKRVCECLLKANADPDLTTKEGVFDSQLKASTVARENNHIELADYIENYPRRRPRLTA